MFSFVNLWLFDAAVPSYVGAESVCSDLRAVIEGITV